MISFSKKVYDEIIAHAKAGYPNEACGILAGPPAKPDRSAGVLVAESQATEFYPMKNMDSSAVSYFMDPKEQLMIFKKMRETALEMRGIFHSHVASEAYPSQKDVRLAFYPDVSYLIVSLSEKEKPVLRSFRVSEDNVAEEAISIL